MATKKAMRLMVSDWVKWKSQSGGFWVEKAGEVVRVLAPGEAPIVTFGTGPLYEEAKKYGAKSQGGSFKGRDHESYLVLVRPVKGKAAPKLYWPVVSTLRKVKARP